MKRLVAVLLVSLVVPAAAHASSLPTGPWGGWVAEMKVPAPPAFTVLIEPCPDRSGGAVDGCTWPGGPVYIEDPDVNDRAYGGRLDARFALYHELGHQFDFQVATHGLRRAFRHDARMRGPWAKEAFADAYAVCAFPRSEELAQWEDDGRVETDYYHATWRAHRRFCKLLRGR